MKLLGIINFILLMHLFRVVCIPSISPCLWFNLLIYIGVIGAQNATLTFMVGAEPDAFKSVQPILSNMGKSVVHVGPNGSGVAAKICNNLLAAIR